MDPIALARVAPAWRAEVVGATFAGLRPWVGGLELVFDRAPDGDRPGRRLALVVRFAPPDWAWLERVEARPRRLPDWLFRLPEGMQVEDLAVPRLDRRIAIALRGAAGEPAALHIEQWPPGNVIAEVPGVRVLWCLRTRAASAHRPALAPGTVYQPAAAPALIDPATADAADLARRLEGWLAPAPPETWPGILSRHLAGLPKGLLEALLPSLPDALAHGRLDPPVLAHELVAWARATWDPAAGVLHAVSWDVPSPGAALLARLPRGADAAWLETRGVRLLGSFEGPLAAAAGLGRALPRPIDPVALGEARGQVRRLERAEAAVLDDLARATEADAARAKANALAAFLPRVAKGAARVSLPDPADPERFLEIELDPTLRPHENADRWFRRAGKLERTRDQAPSRLAAVREALRQARKALEELEQPNAGQSVGPFQRGVPAAPVLPRAERRPRSPGSKGRAVGPGRRKDSVPAALKPRRYRTTEGWEVWIGRSNQGNDHLTHRLARPEDYWMHVHGAPGSHVVLRRGKGSNEPSKATLAEVAAWAAFFSQARNAGTVPVTVTQKKYVRKPRGAPAGLAEVMRSKTVFARPAEPPAQATLADDDDEREIP